MRDLDSGLDTAQAEGRSRLPWQKGDLMLTFTLDNVHTLTLRASGTEPKLKYYLEVYPCRTKHSKHYTLKLSDTLSPRWRTPGCVICHILNSKLRQ